MGPACPTNPNLCQACGRIVDDLQDSTLIDSAIPYELNASDAPAPLEDPDPERADPKTQPSDRGGKRRAGS